MHQNHPNTKSHHAAGRDDHSPEPGEIPKEFESAHATCVAAWGIQDSLLQSYRMLFFTVQSVLFAVAIFVLATHPLLLGAIPPAIGWLLNRDWRGITESRGLDVFYFHWQILLIEKGDSVRKDVFTAFKAWQHDSPKVRHAKLAADEIGRGLLKSYTRTKLDSTIPKTFKYFWIAFIAVWVLEMFAHRDYVMSNLKVFSLAAWTQIAAHIAK